VESRAAVSARDDDASTNDDGAVVPAGAPWSPLDLFAPIRDALEPVFPDRDEETFHGWKILG
jgi:hypothetical protein